MTEHRRARSVFVLRIRLEGDAGGAGIHALRRLLKALLRRYGLRCLSVQMERTP
jgi:hypothetical protein